MVLIPSCESFVGVDPPLDTALESGEKYREGRTNDLPEIGSLFCHAFFVQLWGPGREFEVHL
jgi:hypothetical protein